MDCSRGPGLVPLSGRLRPVAAARGQPLLGPDPAGVEFLRDVLAGRGTAELGTGRREERGERGQEYFNAEYISKHRRRYVTEGTAWYGATRHMRGWLMGEGICRRRGRTDRQEVVIVAGNDAGRPAQRVEVGAADPMSARERRSDHALRSHHEFFMIYTVRYGI